MNNQNNQRLLLISLDGLSADQFYYLQEHYQFLVGLTAEGTIVQLDSKPLNSPQAIWAELLSGLPWHQSGCAGYAYPKSSLNDLDIVKQSTFDSRYSLTDQDSLTINVPLLEPQNGQAWLSDGSLETEMTVSPKALTQEEPFKSYRLRPFTAAGYALANPVKNARECFAVERQRLICALELLKRNPLVKTCIVRLTIFDLLSHLFGSQIFNEELQIQPDLQSFLEFANNCLKEMAAMFSGGTICILSAFSHEKCTERVNLNQLLSQRGLCSLQNKSDVESQYLRRQQASLMVAQDISQPDATTVVAISNLFDTAATKAASPIHGAIYLNSKERFNDGILPSSDNLIDEVADYLTDCLQKQAGDKTFVCEVKPPNDSHPMAPDCLVYAKGIDFHNSYDAPSIDAFSHPQTCHNPEGFVWLSEPAGHNTIKPTQLHTLLMMSCT